MAWCCTDGIISGVHPPRQIRLGPALLVLPVLLCALARLPAAAASQKEPKAPEFAARLDWTREVASAPASLPAYDETHAFFALSTGQLAAVSLIDGKVSWTVPCQAAGSLEAGEKLVFAPVAGGIQAHDAATGAVRWQAGIEGRISAPLAWQNGWLLAATDTGAAVMLRGATGERIWQRSLDAPARVRPALTGNRVYVALENGRVAALDLATGLPAWSRALGGRATAVAPLDDRLFVGADDRFLYCLSAKSGKRLWRWRTGGPVSGTPIFDEDNVYFLSLDNVLRALDRGNGHEVWHASLTFRPTAGPYRAGRLLLVSGLTALHGFRAADGSEAGGAEAGGVLAAPPHFLPADEEGFSPFLLLTREGQASRMTQTPPPLPSKPFPAKPVYPLWPLAEGVTLSDQISTGARCPASSSLITFARRRTPSTIFSFEGSENESRIRLAPVPSTKNALPAT
jgi:outer membrane protein assembly factor BamB